MREWLGTKEMIQLLRDLAFVKESDAHTEESIFGVGIVVCDHTVGTADAARMKTRAPMPRD